jgi:hypothetical protein
MWTSMPDRFRRLSGWLFLLFLLFPAPLTAAEIFLSPLNQGKGDRLEAVVVIDEVANLAGVKLVLTYDPNVLIYKEGRKTAESQSMMHVVNDRTPGKLVIVMACAQGISGRNLPIMKLTFALKNKKSDRRNIRIDPVEVQLMSDQLKEISCKPANKNLDFSAPPSVK